MQPSMISDEQKAEYRVPGEETGKPWRCTECGQLLGYIQRRLVSIHTSDADQPLGERTISRQINVLQRIGPRGERGDLIIGDADVRCGTCENVKRWDCLRTRDGHKR